MQPILDLLFRLYRAAYEMPLGDFDDATLSMIGMVVPFCAAVWLVGAIERGTPRLLRAHLYGLLPDALRSFAPPSPQLSQALIVAAADAGRAHQFRAPDLCHEHPEALVLADGSSVESQLLIAESGASPEPASWLSLYRARGEAQFDEDDSRTASLVMPHLAQAFVLNRAVHPEKGAVPRRNAVSERSVIRADGTFLHCGARLTGMIRAEFPTWDGLALPARFLNEALRGGAVHFSQGQARVDVSRLGDTLLLTVRQTTPADRLSPRELAVAQMFGAGASYKEIARRVTLAPATVRNVVQNAYRKLGINNKAQLARLMAVSD